MSLKWAEQEEDDDEADDAEEPVHAAPDAPANDAAEKARWQQNKGSAPAKVDPAKLKDWIRRRVFELRVQLSISPEQLLNIFQEMEDSQLQAPFTEVKLWLGLDETEPLPVGVDQLVVEFRAARGGTSIAETWPAPTNSNGNSNGGIAEWNGDGWSAGGGWGRGPARGGAWGR